MAPSSLLDFITTLVHDPAAAAAYHADPQSALTAANLHDVTTADVDHLIPVVAESSHSAPTSGSIWSASDAAHSFDTAVGDAFAGPGDVQSPIVIDHTAAESDSPFDPFAVPDVDPAILDADSGDIVPNDLSTTQISDETDAPSDFADVPQAPADSDWLDRSPSGDFGFDGHNHSTVTDHSAFDDL
ncbi:IniB N-terminal domain-containing protein [Gordonia effusa]|nr:IniB N-terminal domain-containing protein [Gordonia effusa]